MAALTLRMNQDHPGSFGVAILCGLATAKS
jgi:hypothetical protein